MEENNYTDDQFYEEEDIDWSKYIGAAIRNWKKIAIVTFAFAILSVVVALFQKRVYSVAVTLAPEAQGSRSGSSSLGSIASMFGVNLGSGSSSSDALNITIFPDIASSTPFLTQLFPIELNAKPILPKDPIEARKVLEGPLPSVKLYDHAIGLDKEPGLIKKLLTSILGEKPRDPEYLKVNPNALTKEQEKVLNYLKAHISVDVDKKTAMTTINVSLDDPMMCSQLADTVCSRLQRYVYNYRTEKERKNFEYYEELCDSAYVAMTKAQAAYAANVDNDHSVILQKVSVRRERLQQEASLASQLYQQMVQQRELSRAQLQEMKPVFAVVQPASMPLKPSNSRRATCMKITFIGFVLAFGWYVVAKDWIAEQLKTLNLKDIAKQN